MKQFLFYFLKGKRENTKIKSEETTFESQSGTSHLQDSLELRKRAKEANEMSRLRQ